jgi:hypothetical protein
LEKLTVKIFENDEEDEKTEELATRIELNNVRTRGLITDMKEEIKRLKDKVGMNEQSLN